MELRPNDDCDAAAGVVCNTLAAFADENGAALKLFGWKLLDPCSTVPKVERLPAKPSTVDTCRRTGELARLFTPCTEALAISSATPEPN